MSSELQPSAVPTTSESSTTATGGTSSSSSGQVRAAVQRTTGYDAQMKVLEPRPGSAPVQRDGGGAGTGGVHEAAARGVASGGGSLPYGDKVQHSFGAFDVSQVQAHTGSAATQASADMGAEAYATGDHVVFGGSPDLHTVAHEAAHVVQQQAGVALSGGVGQTGDRYEQHADKVADAVVQGKLAEPILSEMTGRGAGGVQQKAKVQQRSISRAVQRLDPPNPAPNAAPTAATPPATQTNAPGNQATPPNANANATAPNTAPAPPDPAVERQARTQEVANVANPPIAQAPEDPPVTLNAQANGVQNMKSDSPDPVMLKDKVITLTQAFLALQNPEPAVKQAKLDEIKATFEQLRVAMKTARGEGQVLVDLRVQFEKYLGSKATGWIEGTSCIDNMVTTAKNMIAAEHAPAAAEGQSVDARLAALPPEKKAAIEEKIGSPVDIGFAGVVGQSFDRIIAALDAGSPVQRAQGLIGFADGYLLPGLLKGSGAVFTMAKNILAVIQPEIDLEALVTQSASLDKKAKKALLLTSPVFRAKLLAAGGNAGANNQARADEKGSAMNPGANVEVMDTKIPEQPVEVCTEQQLDFIAGEIKPPKEGEQAAYPNFQLGEYRNQQGAQAKAAYLISVGIKTTKPKGAAVDATSTVAGAQGITEPVPGAPAPVDDSGLVDAVAQENYAYIEGKLENIVDPKNKWIMNAADAQAPMKAGISGTTARFVGAAEMMGGSKYGATVVMLGHLQAIEAHSFWEIVDAAGIGMSAGKYLPFPPNESGMDTAADEFIAQNGYATLGPIDKNDAKKKLLGT